MKGPVKPDAYIDFRTNLEVIELAGILCFMFRSPPSKKYPKKCKMESGMSCCSCIVLVITSFPFLLPSSSALWQSTRKSLYTRIRVRLGHVGIKREEGFCKFVTGGFSLLYFPLFLFSLFLETLIRSAPGLFEERATLFNYHWSQQEESDEIIFADQIFNAVTYNYNCN